MGSLGNFQSCSNGHSILLLPNVSQEYAIVRTPELEGSGGRGALDLFIDHIWPVTRGSEESCQDPPALFQLSRLIIKFIVLRIPYVGYHRSRCGDAPPSCLLTEGSLRSYDSPDPLDDWILAGLSPSLILQGHVKSRRLRRWLLGNGWLKRNKDVGPVTW